jgi:hypothetical protein
MSALSVFLIRLVLGGGFSFVLGRMFYPDANSSHLAGLGIILVGLAYFAEFLRNRQNR